MKKTVAEQIEFLKKLQQALRYQEELDNDVQAAPRFWTVGDYRWEPCWEDQAERFDIHSPRMEADYEFDELKKELLEKDADEFDWDEDILAELHDASDEEELIDWVKEHYDEDAYCVPVKKNHIIHPNTMFLTKDEAKRHIEGNKHHYSSEAHTYAMTAWRAPTVSRLFELLQDFDWDAIEIKESVEK